MQRHENIGRAQKMHVARITAERERTTAPAEQTPTGAREIRIGCSGWYYWHWKSLFYPEDLPSNQWFSHYASRFKTVELNAPFYSWPTVATVESWLRQCAGRPFVYTVKVNELIRVYHWCVQQFGVIRSDSLRRTQLYGNYPQSDRAFLAELAMHGRFQEIPEDLFHFRDHRQVSMAMASRLPLMAWAMDPSKQGRLVFPTWRLYSEWWKVVARAPIAARERAWAFIHLVQWPFRGLNAARLARDLAWAGPFMARRLLARAGAAIRGAPETPSVP